MNIGEGGKTEKQREENYREQTQGRSGEVGGRMDEMKDGH